MRGRMLLAVVAVTIAGMACDPDDPDDPLGKREIAVPDWWTDRAPMPSCGRFEPEDIRFDNDDLDEANACLADAFEAGEPAELVYTQLTEEGDPGRSIYRVVGVRELEVMLDRREDAHSSLAFGHLLCHGLVQQELTVAPVGCEASNDRRIPSTGEVERRRQAG